MQIKSGVKFNSKIDHFLKMLCTNSDKSVISTILRLLLMMITVSFINSQLDNLQYDDIEEKPDRCYAPPSFLYLQCCILPPFFARDIAKKCGAMYAVVEDDRSRNITYRRRHLLQGCSSWRCILRVYKMETEQGNFDHEKYYKHLERWVELNSDFAEVMTKAKTSCKEIMEPYLPLELCQFKRLHFCVRRVIELNCPNIRDTEDCAKQREFFEKCGKFYLKK